MRLLSFMLRKSAFIQCLLCITSIQALSTQLSPEHRSLPLWIRADHDFHHLRISPRGRFLAFTKADGSGLSLLELDTLNIFRISDQFVGPSFFWSPDGFRLFYRELIKSSTAKNPEILSELKAFDTKFRKSVSITMVNSPSGYLSFDPRDFRFYLLHPSGILTRRLQFPDERLAHWQSSLRYDMGKWLTTQGGVMWISHGGFDITRMPDDESGVQSFSLHSDGRTIAWATNESKIFVAVDGQSPEFVDYGFDPQWHPSLKFLVYAGGQRIANKIIDYDIKLAKFQHQNGQPLLEFLYRSQFTHERWPQWSVAKSHVNQKKNSTDIIFTKSKTTDLFKIKVKV